MRLNFLCEHHRRSLMASPDAAGELWCNSLDRLEELAPAATPYRVNLTGSALEAAGIYLIANPACDAIEIARYVRTALSLVELLGQLSQDRLVLIVVAGANATLEHLARNGADSAAAARGRRRLKIEGMRHIDSPRAPLHTLPRESSRSGATLH